MAKQKRAIAKLNLDPAIIKARRAGPAFQDVWLCNCARCDGELIGESYPGRYRHSAYYGIPIVFGRLSGRPYCQACYRAVESFQVRTAKPSPPAA